jgi:predicted amidohydrolase YtcJ
MDKSMRFLGVLLLLLSWVLAGCQKAPESVPPSADLVLRNGYVYTADAGRRVAEAIALRGNRIIAVGRDEEVAAFIGESTRVMDLEGRMVLPGLHDVHIHTLGIVQPDICDIRSQPMGLDQLVPFLRDCLARYDLPPGDWLAVPQWNFTTGNQPSRDYPNLRAALDAVSDERPIILYGNDGHHGAVNSVALSRASNETGEVIGLDARTLAEDFSGFSQLVAVDASGEPTGGVNEGARDLMNPPSIFDVMLGAGDSVQLPFMRKVAAKLAQNGITTVQDAAMRPASLEAFADLEKSGQMSFRLYAALFEKPENSRAEEGLAAIPDLVQTFSRVREQYAGDPLIHAKSVKIFIDGVIEGDPLATPPTLPNAAVLSNYRQPRFLVDVENERLDLLGYVDTGSELCRAVRADPSRYKDHSRSAAFLADNGFYPRQCEESNGVLEHSEKFIHEFVQQMTEAGFNVHAHAIGDRAVRVVLDAFEETRATAEQAGLSQSIAHAQLVHPDDQQRLGKLGIYLALTFAWALPDPVYDMSVIPFVEQLDGPGDMYNPDLYYMQNVYPAAGVQKLGGVIVAGSDAPVDTREPRPFINLQQAVTRSAEGRAYNAKERLDIHEAIAAYTINGARMLGQSQQLGSLEAGKLADLIVVDQNLVELAEQDQADHISGTQVLMTVFDGKVVFEAAGL